VADRRKATFYVVLERGTRGYQWNKARVVRHTANKPTDLRGGQCAVKITVDVPDEAFDPVLDVPEIAFAVADVLRANASKEPA